MRKQIQFRGISRTPSDRLTADGGCAESLNVFLDNSESAPMLWPTDITAQYGAVADSGEYDSEFLYIHKGTGYNNLIFLNRESNIIEAFTAGQQTAAEVSDLLYFQLDLDESVLQVTSIGNTLLVNTNKRTEYFRYKRGAYKDLGDHIPVPMIEFRAEEPQDTAEGSVTRLLKKKYAPVEIDGSGGFIIGAAISFNVNLLGYDIEDKEDQRAGWKEFTNTLWDEISLRRSYIRKKRNLCAPVFVRSALRLYDNSYIYHSVPVMLGADIERFFTAVANVKKTSQNICDSSLVLTMAHQYSAVAYLKTYNYEDWKDIITSIDLFMSTEIHSPQMNADVEDIKEINTIDNITRYKIVFKDTDDEQDVKDRIASEVLSKGNFYRVASFSPEKFGRLTNGYNLLKDENLASEDYLVTQPTLPDDYQTNHRKLAERLFKYNNRLIMQDVTSIITSGYPFLNGEAISTAGVSTKYRLKYYLRDSLSNELSVLARNEEGHIVLGGVTTRTEEIPSSQVQNAPPAGTDVSEPGEEENGDPDDPTIQPTDPLNPDTGGGTGGGGGTTTVTETISRVPMAWLAYPDSRCYRVDVCVMEYRDGVLQSETTYKYDMVPHPRLNCSYLFLGMGMTIGYSGGEEVSFSLTEQRQYREENIVWASKMDNPWYFPLEGRIAFSAKVLAMETATRPLSQGQIGQFPLMVFTEDGVWSIPITSDGGFGAVWPITRDVLASPNSLKGIEQAVVFVTEQGVMLFSGNEVTPVSPYMNGAHYVLPEEIVEVLRSENRFRPIEYAYTDTMVFNKFMEGARIAYDYINRRLIFYRDDRLDQYVDCLNTSTWHKASLMGSGYLMGMLNSYPYCYACKKNVRDRTRLMNVSVALDTSTEQDTMPMLLVTRPFDLEEPDVRKSISKIAIRGQMNKGDAQYMLLGTMDGIHWQRLRSLRGSSFKQFRLVVIGFLSPTERISWVDIEYQSRFTNKLR